MRGGRAVVALRPEHPLKTKYVLLSCPNSAIVFTACSTTSSTVARAAGDNGSHEARRKKTRNEPRTSLCRRRR